jgi:hypothetical protein
MPAKIGIGRRPRTSAAPAEGRAGPRLRTLTVAHADPQQPPMGPFRLRKEDETGAAPRPEVW